MLNSLFSFFKVRAIKKSQKSSASFEYLFCHIVEELFNKSYNIILYLKSVEIFLHILNRVVRIKNSHN